jgi:hypothetical protein
MRQKTKLEKTKTKPVDERTDEENALSDMMFLLRRSAEQVRAMLDSGRYDFKLVQHCAWLLAKVQRMRERALANQPTVMTIVSWLRAMDANARSHVATELERMKRGNHLFGA